MHEIAALAQVGAPVHLAIGVFDGVHRGHQAVIQAAVDGAAVGGGVPVVVTFTPHPVAVLRPGSAPRLLASPPHRRRILARFGIRHVLEVRFDQQFAAREADDFIRDLAAPANRVRQICVGAEWNFGRGRRGNVALLRELGAQLGFAVSGVGAVRSGDGEVISSTLVRDAVRRGDFARARELLGREYSVLGDVVEGRKLGRTIGFPTANLAVHSEQLPPSGVYAVDVELDDHRLAGVANLGHRPTVEGDGAQRLLEVHLLDFERDIYGAQMEVWFNQRIRQEQKFPDLDSLKAQIAQDVAHARSRRRTPPPSP